MVTTTHSSTSSGTFGVVAVTAMGLGSLIVAYGMLILPASIIGGIHVVAIGLSLVLSGLFATEWAGDRWGLSTAARNRLSLMFLVLTGVLLVAFVFINVVSFEGPVVESGSESGN